MKNITTQIRGSLLYFGIGAILYAVFEGQTFDINFAWMWGWPLA
jgi:hypothetical protein